MCYVKARQIYVLRDPRTNLVHYVGSTQGWLEGRLYGHCGDMKDAAKRAWILELRAEGLRPQIEAIDSVRASLGVRIGAERLEAWWAQYFRERGHPVLNRKKSNLPHSPIWALDLYQ